MHMLMDCHGAPTLRLDWLENLGIEPPGEMKPVGPSGGREKIFFTEASLYIGRVRGNIKSIYF